MTPFDKLVNDMVQELIVGNSVFIKDEGTKKEVQKRLRKIKKNCTIVLSQLKNNY